MANCTIPSNPDVSGIGVRAAIYAQNLACFLPVIVHLLDGKISRDELKGIKDQSIGMLAVAFAILVTTVILAKGAGGDQTITNYHAAVVLNLSWMNNTSTWIWFILFVHNRSKPNDDQPPTPANWREWRAILVEPLEKLRNKGAGDKTGRTGGRSIGQRRGIFKRGGIAQRIRRIAQHIWHVAQNIWRFLSEQPVLSLGSIHLSLMAAVGIWLWIDPSKFGQDVECATITVVGAPARFSSKPLRIASLTMYSLVLIPGFNLFPPFLFFLTLHISFNWFRGPHQSFQAWWAKAISRSSSDGPHPPSESPPRTAFLIAGLGFLVAFNILFIVDIERTLRRNKGDENGDAEWGFGQVLALLLLVIPLRDAWGALREIRENRNGSQRQFEELLLRECQATSAVKELKRLINQEANVNIWTADRKFGSTLELVAYYGKTELVEFLLKEPTVIEDKAHGDYGTPLQAASARGHVPIVKKLLGNEKSKRGLNAVGGRYGTALCAACANGNIEVVNDLLQAGASLKVDGECFGAPLHVAVLMGSVEMARLLLDHNQNDANCHWKAVGNAAYLAVLVGNQELVDLLRGRGLTEAGAFFYAERARRERAVSAAASGALAEGWLIPFRSSVQQFDLQNTLREYVQQDGATE